MARPNGASRTTAIGDTSMRNNPQRLDDLMSLFPLNLFRKLTNERDSLSNTAETQWARFDRLGAPSIASIGVVGRAHGRSRSQRPTAQDLSALGEMHEPYP